MFWQIRLLLILLAAVELSFSQNSSPALQINPAAPQQGDTLRISSSRPATHARLGDRRIQLFAQTDNTLLGLMPIAANHRPGQFPIEILDSKGAVLTTQTVVIRKANFLEQNVQLTRTLQELKAAPGDAEAMRQFQAIVSTDRNWFEPLSSPVPGCVVSPYGVQRLHNGKPTGNYHSGIDQRGAAGTPVRAAAAGTVRLVKPLALGGNTVG
ncbi:MAG: M23 family metallopeptidase, partial [Bryobacteraceae bacterium]|nr:M23 family metallopeptidase [Bryobacteraceae bacterium]